MSNHDVPVQEDVGALIRRALSKPTMYIGYDGNNDRILANLNSFLELSKGNIIVEEVHLDPNWYDNQNRIQHSDADWEEKLGRALGNLQSLKVIRIW
jgi:hypothetical protein